MPGNMIPGLAVLVNTRCLEPEFHAEGVIYSDCELWVRLFASYRVGFVPAVLADYRVHDSNTRVGMDPSLNVPRYVQVVEALEDKVESVPGLQRPRVRALLALEHAYLDFYCDRFAAAADHLANALELDPGLRESPAPLGYFFARWESDSFHTRLSPEHYVELAAKIRDAGPAAVGGHPIDSAAGNFGLWVLSAQPRPPTERAAREWLTLVRAVQHVAAAQQHWRTGSRIRAGARLAEAFRIYPRLLSDRSLGSLLSHTLQPLMVRATSLRAAPTRGGG